MVLASVFSVLTIARVLDRIPIIVINDITAITLFSNDSFGCAVASASFVIALFGLVVTLTCCREKKCQIEAFYPESWIYEFWRGFVNLCNFKCNCIYKITMISVRKNRIRRFKIREVKPSDENIISKIEWIFDLRKNFSVPKIFVHKMFDLRKVSRTPFFDLRKKNYRFWGKKGNFWLKNAQNLIILTKK